MKSKFSGGSAKVSSSQARARRIRLRSYLIKLMLMAMAHWTKMRSKGCLGYWVSSFLRMNSQRSCNNLGRIGVFRYLLRVVLQLINIDFIDTVATLSIVSIHRLM